MFITNKPNQIVAGSPSTLEIDTAQLLSELNVSDSHWTFNNISQIILEYKDGTGVERHAVQFPAQQTSAALLVSSSALLNTWQLTQVLLLDYDNGTYVVPRSEFPVSTAYDIPVISAS